jgi:hypothetical protein
MNAFPISIPAGCEGYEDGMTLRDYFATQILNGIIASGKPSGTVREMAERAYIYADIMLEVRGE